MKLLFLMIILEFGAIPNNHQVIGIFYQYLNWANAVIPKCPSYFCWCNGDRKVKLWGAV